MIETANIDVICETCRKRLPYCRCGLNHGKRSVAAPSGESSSASLRERLRNARPSKRVPKHLHRMLSGPLGEMETKIIEDLNWLHERDPQLQSATMSGAKYAYSKCLGYLRQVAREKGPLNEKGEP